MEDEEFDRLLKISRIKLDEKEKQRIKTDIENILEYFDSVNKFDESKNKLAFHSVEINGEPRKDEVEKFEDREELLSNTKTYRGFVVGPKI